MYCRVVQMWSTNTGVSLVILKTVININLGWTSIYLYSIKLRKIPLIDQSSQHDQISHSSKLSLQPDMNEPEQLLYTYHSMVCVSSRLIAVQPMLTNYSAANV